MKNVSYNTKMRWIAGGIYMALAAYQMMCLYSVFSSSTASASNTLTTATLASLLAVMLMFLSGFIGVWLLSKKTELDKDTRRGFLFATGFWIFLEAMSYSGQAQLIRDSFGIFFTVFKQENLPAYIVMLVRLLLLVFAAVFVFDDENDGTEDGEDVGTDEDRPKNKKEKRALLAKKAEDDRKNKTAKSAKDEDSIDNKEAGKKADSETEEKTAEETKEFKNETVAKTSAAKTGKSSSKKSGKK